MSRSAKVRLEWGDGEYDFRLAIGQLDEYDDLTGCGPGFALGLIQTGPFANWKPKMVREAIRLGLIGGGMEPFAALAPGQALRRRPAHWREPGHRPGGSPGLGRGRAGGANPGALGEGVGPEPLPCGRIRFGQLYGSGAAIGFSRADVRDCSLWEFAHASHGWRAANCPTEGISEAEFDRIAAELDAREEAAHGD